MIPTQTTLQQQLTTDCQSFIDVANAFSDDDFNRQAGGKWSVADVMQHLYLSARPVAQLIAGPRTVLLQWGRPAAPSGSYDELASAYKAKLAAGAKAPAAMTPRPEDMQVAKQDVLARFAGVYDALAEGLANWSAQELNDYVIPHPVLGKLTVREMVYFVSIHTQHHLRLLPNP